MKTAIAAALLLAATAAHAGPVLTPSPADGRPFGRAEIAGPVVGEVTRTVEGGCIVPIRMKPTSDDYAPFINVWIPVAVAQATPSIGYWCVGIKPDDYLSVKATLDGWGCGPDLCGRPWVKSIVAHLRKK